MAFLSSLFDYDVPGTEAQSDAAAKQLVGRIRLLLAVSVLFVAVIEPHAQGRPNIAFFILSCYAAACALVTVGAELHVGPTLDADRFMHWLDAGVFVAIFAAGRQDDVFPLVFLCFAIVVASVRFGVGEGARVTIVAFTLCWAAAVVTLPNMPPMRQRLSVAVLLTFGGAIALLGEKIVQAVRRQAMLRELNQVTNPRFGIDRSMTAALECTRKFFMADSCFVLLEEHDTGRYEIRSVHQDGPPEVAPATIDTELARALLPGPLTRILVYRAARTLFGRWRFGAGMAHSRVEGSGRWSRQDDRVLQELGALLEAGSFVSAHVRFGRGQGRVYVIARGRHLGRSDAMFLARIAQQDLHAIDRVDLLDRMASEAAAVERKKMALDLHDTAIQSYIGLQMGLMALYKRADPSNPLIGDLDKLVTMAADVIVQLRGYANRTCGEPGAKEPFILAALRRQAAQVMASYGVDVRVDIDGPIVFGDRLTAEVLQIVREGVSNICRHTAAKHAIVSLDCSNGMLRIEINNEHGGKRPPPFRPHSISERAAALGGHAFVRQGRFNDTIVCVEIPL
jgi:signal transduction histidine kinase